MEYYSVIENNEILPFAATWMDLEIIILSEVNQRQILYEITYMWNLKNSTNEFSYKIFSQTWKRNLWLLMQKEGGRQISSTRLTEVTI